jgi:hypothetical protein
MEKYLQINAKLKRTEKNDGYVLILFIGDNLLNKCKELKVDDGR